jgi:hypothetical protein
VKLDRPVVSYASGALKVLRCGDATCSSGNTVADPDSAAGTVWYTSLVLDANGFPVVSYFEIPIGALPESDFL